MPFVRLFARPPSSLGFPELAFGRTVSPDLAALPVHLALRRLRGAPDCILGTFSATRAEQIRVEAAQRGIEVEIQHDGYCAAYVERALGAESLPSNAVRGVFLPAFAPEAIITARFDAGLFSVELRRGREPLWATQFRPWFLHDVARRPGVDVTCAVADASTSEVARARFRRAGGAAPEPPSIGLDGISISLHGRLPDLQGSFEVWSPSVPGYRGYETVAALVDLTGSIDLSNVPAFDGFLASISG